MFRTIFILLLSPLFMSCTLELTMIGTKELKSQLPPKKENPFEVGQKLQPGTYFLGMDMAIPQDLHSTYFTLYKLNTSTNSLETVHIFSEYIISAEVFNNQLYTSFINDLNTMEMFAGTFDGNRLHQTISISTPATLQATSNSLLISTSSSNGSSPLYRISQNDEFQTIADDLLLSSPFVLHEYNETYLATDFTWNILQGPAGALSAVSNTVGYSLSPGYIVPLRNRAYFAENPDTSKLIKIENGSVSVLHQLSVAAESFTKIFTVSSSLFAITENSTSNLLNLYRVEDNGALTHILTLGDKTYGAAFIESIDNGAFIMASTPTNTYEVFFFNGTHTSQISNFNAAVGTNHRVLFTPTTKSRDVITIRHSILTNPTPNDFITYLVTATEVTSITLLPCSNNEIRYTQRIGTRVILHADNCTLISTDSQTTSLLSGSYFFPKNFLVY